MLLHFRSSINDSHRKQTIFATFLQHVVSRYLKKQMKNYLAFQETKEWLWTFFVKQYFSKFFFLPFRCFAKNIYVQKLFSDRKHILKRFNIFCDIQIRIYIVNVQFIKPQKIISFVWSIPLLFFEGWMFPSLSFSGSGCRYDHCWEWVLTNWSKTRDTRSHDLFPQILRTRSQFHPSRSYELSKRFNCFIF